MQQIRHFPRLRCPLALYFLAGSLFLTGCASNPGSSKAIAPTLEPLRSERNVPPIPDVDVLALNQEMIDFLEREIDISGAKQKKIHQILHVIFHSSQLNLQYGNEKTKTAIETYTSGRGNCISFANLFIAMARHFRIDARFQELIITPTWNREGELLWLSRHINVFGKLPLGFDYTVDFLPDLISQRNKIRKTKVISDKRAYAQYYNNIGAEYLTLNEPEKAFAYFRKALEIDNTLSFVWSNMATLYSRNGQVVMAEKAFQYAIQLNPREYPAINSLANLYTDLGRLEEANYFADRVKHFRERNPYYHFALGESAYEAGDYRDASRHFQKAISKKKREHEFHFALAKAYFHLGLQQKAQRKFEDARQYASLAKDDIKYERPLDWYTTHEEDLGDLSM